MANQEKCIHPGCKNHVSHPCEVCGYQAGKTNQSTFWLARGDDHYLFSSRRLVWDEDHWIFTCRCKDACPLSQKTIGFLGLPTLRKGQQVQVKRTANGFEVVKGKS